MARKLVFALILALILAGMFGLVFRVQRVEASGTIYIRVDGSVEGTDKIQREGNVYTFTDNIVNQSIVVEGDNIVVDGAGYTLQGARATLSRGVDLTGRSNVTARNTNIEGFFYGVYLNLTSDSTISENTVTNNVGAICLVESSSNIISENKIENNSHPGIRFVRSNHNSIYGNNITNNDDCGIAFYGFSNYNTISGNNITANSAIGIELAHPGSSNHNVISGNNIVANAGTGIIISYSSNYNSVSGNSVINNFGGIWVHDSSSNNIISGNNITGKYDGIDLGYHCNYNTVSGNSISRIDVTNDWLHRGGITLFESSSNTIFGNNITNYDYGIRIINSTNNSIFENEVANNAGGIWLKYSASNKFYHNNLIDNTQQVHIYTPGFTDSWDDGYPSGGNYWSDYDERYPSATEIDDSGIWDTPYVIDENNQDNYPLVPEFPSLLVLPLFMIATLLAIIIYRRKNTM